MDEQLDGIVGCKSRRLREEVKRSGGDVGVVEEHSFRGCVFFESFQGRDSARGLSVVRLESESDVLAKLTCDKCLFAARSDHHFSDHSN